MKTLARTLKAFLEDDSAPTAAEYALMLGAVVLVVAGAAYLVGGRIADIFNRTASALR